MPHLELRENAWLAMVGMPAILRASCNRIRSAPVWRAIASERTSLRRRMSINRLFNGMRDLP